MKKTPKSRKAKSAQRCGPVQTGKTPRGKPFATGEDPRRNPGGLPPEVREIRELLMLEGPAMVRALARAIRKGNHTAAVKGLEFIIGKPPQAIQVSGPNGQPVQIAAAQDLTKLNADQLKQLEALLECAAKPDTDSGAGKGGMGTP